MKRLQTHQLTDKEKKQSVNCTGNLMGSCSWTSLKRRPPGPPAAPPSSLPCPLLSLAPYIPAVTITCNVHMMANSMMPITAQTSLQLQSPPLDQLVLFTPERPCDRKGMTIYILLLSYTRYVSWHMHSRSCLAAMTASTCSVQKPSLLLMTHRELQYLLAVGMMCRVLQILLQPKVNKAYVSVCSGDLCSPQCAVAQ